MIHLQNNFHVICDLGPTAFFSQKWCLYSWKTVLSACERQKSVAGKETICLCVYEMAQIMEEGSSGGSLELKSRCDCSKPANC